MSQRINLSSNNQNSTQLEWLCDCLMTQVAFPSCESYCSLFDQSQPHIVQVRVEWRLKL